MSEDTPVAELTEEVVAQDQDQVTTEETTESTEPEGETQEKKTEEKSKEPEPKKNHDARRWERLTRERAEYKAKADLYEQQMHAKAQEPADGKVPARESFGSDEEYVMALTKHIVSQQLGTVKQELTQHSQRSQQQTEWVSKIAVAKENYTDYDAVMEDAQDIPCPQHVADALQSSDIGADIAYYLAKNPDEALRINSLPPMAAAREVGRIESYIEYEKTNKAKAKPVSTAPAPIKPPAKSSSGAAGKSLEDMSPAEYISYRNKQATKRR